MQTAPIAYADFVASHSSIRFGRFLVLPRARKIFADGRPVELGSRAFDLLVVLLEARGTLVSKEEIAERVWPTTVVDESNLRVQMVALRRVLGSDRDVIKTIPGRGYVFTNEDLAIDEPSASAQVALRPESAIWAEQGNGADPSGESEPTVVVIDDDAEIRAALEGLLRSAGLRVEMFASAREYMESARAARPGCMVLDVWLPGQNGMDFHDALIKANPDLPVIFISGHADIPMSVRAMKAGAVEFLTKPVRHQDLLRAIQQAIGTAA